LTIQYLFKKNKKNYYLLGENWKTIIY